MSHLSLPLIAAACGLLVAGTAAAQPTSAAVATAADSLAVIGVANDLLRAISTADTALARRVLLPGSQLGAVTDPAAPTATARLVSDNAFLASISGQSGLLERMWSPTAEVHGTIAIVRGPYDFHIKGVFSHCGTDVFTLVRSRGEWRISHIVYTAQREQCAPSPLGPPKPSSTDSN